MTRERQRLQHGGVVLARNGEGRGAGTDCSMWGSSSVAVECGDMVEMALRAPKWVQKGCRKAVRCRDKAAPDELAQAHGRQRHGGTLDGSSSACSSVCIVTG